MQSYLGARASCQICFEPFGRLEELKAPYAVACGHIFCVGCLDNNDPCCRICGAPFDRHPYSRLLALNGLAAAKDSTPPGYEQLGPQLQEAMGLVNEYTNVRHLRSLHERATFFLDSQPRNRFKDLDTSVHLLGCLLQAKDASEAQSQLMSVLTERVHRLTYEKSELQTKLDEMDRRHAYDHASLVDRIPNLMRKNPDFNLLTDEVIAFRTEMNDLKSSVHHICHPDTSPPPSTPSVIHSTPKIRVHPASRSPTPDPSHVNDVDNSRGLSPLPYGFNQFAAYHFDTAVEATDIPNLDPSTASDSSDSDTPFNATLSDSDSDSDAEQEDEDTTHSGIRMLSEMAFSNEQDSDASQDQDILRQTGYVPATVENREASVIHQPRAIYPGSDQISSVRFNLDTDEPSIQSPDPDYYPDTPGSDVDSIMAMSCSSLPILKTPANFRVRELEPHQINNTALRDGLPAPVSPLRMRPPSLFSNIENLKDLLSDSKPEISSRSNIANSTGSRPPTCLLSSTVDSTRSGTSRHRGPSTISRAVTRSKSFPNLLSKTTIVSNEVRSEAMPGQARLVAEMRSCLIEVIARVFLHLVTDGNGQVPSPSAMLSRTHAAAMYTSRGLDSQAQSSISAIVDALDDGLASATADLISSSTSSGSRLNMGTNLTPLPSDLIQRSP